MVLAACTNPRPSVDDPGEAVGGSPADATRIVQEWLQEAGTGADDLGWSLLFPNVRTDIIKSEDIYREAITTADWTKMHYTIGPVRTDDGEYRVGVTVPGGIGAVPAPMRDWGLIQFPSTDGVPSDDGFMTVRIDPSGFPWGIQATG